jgi:hypothetical protein
MNPELDAFLTKAQAVMVGELNGSSPQLKPESKMHFGFRAKDDNFWNKPQRRVHVGVDLGTAYTVLAVLDEQMQPLAGEYRFAQIVRDGLRLSAWRSSHRSPGHPPRGRGCRVYLQSYRG